MEFKINMAAVLVSVVANYIIGAIWYMPLFGKIWGREMGYDPNMKPDKKLMYKGMIYMIIGNFLFAWVFAHNTEAWRFVPGMNEMSTFSKAFSSAFFTWLGFYLPGFLSSTVWERKSWTLFFINSSYQFIALIVVSMILTYWR
ncbi:MAG: DUF1761 domain-containing protein [Candidatus Kapabacteria bacterium]|nr:DUF1761 domain-containing protein [Candidatus Kapabacteria bacterium]